MNQFTCIIIDDDEPSVRVLADALSKHDDISVTGTAGNLSKGRELITATPPDILFLDIELNDESGLDLLTSLTDCGALSNTKVVFYTSYNKYLINAIRFQAFDFLLKPFDPEELNLILNRCRMAQCSETKECCCSNSTSSSSETLTAPLMSKSLSITTVTNERIITSPAEILYFKYDSRSKLWEVSLNTLQRFILRRHTTAELILRISDNYIRTHKSFILNISYLSRLTASECILIPPYNNITEIKISKNYRRLLLDRFMEL